MQKENVPPFLADVISKVKHLEELTPEEEVVYLVHIEDMPEGEAKLKVADWYGKGPVSESGF
jgi:hypothetical protein